MIMRGEKYSNNGNPPVELAVLDKELAEEEKNRQEKAE